MKPLIVYIIVLLLLSSCKKEYSFSSTHECPTLYWELVQPVNGKMVTSYQDFGKECTGRFDTAWYLICGGPNKGRWIYR